MRSFVPHPCMCLLALLFLTLSVQAQDDFALIRKNYNVLANDLYHDLNSTKDTLLLKSPKLIYRVYTVGENSGLIDHTIHERTFKVPLSHLKKGRYVFVVDRLKQKIVFQVEVLKSRDLVSETSKEIKKNTVVEVMPAMTEKVTTIARSDMVEEHVPYKPYNISDYDRRNMQTREEIRRITKARRQQLLLEAQKRRARKQNNANE